MSQIERMRQTLYKVMEAGNADDILKVSQELDKLIVLYMQNWISAQAKLA